MCSRFLSLVIAVLTFTSLSQAQTIWSKSSYHVPGQGNIERADFTSDGLPDLLIYGSRGLQILPNVGNGTFDTDRVFKLNQFVSNLTLLDFNRDGKIDVAACGDGTKVFEGTGDGTLTPGLSLPIGCGWIASADFNGDGNPDIAIALSSPDQVIVLLGDGHLSILGQVATDISFSSNTGDSCEVFGYAVAADFTGDKKGDLAMLHVCEHAGEWVSSILVVGKGDGTGHFSFHKDHDLDFILGQKLRLTDADQDGRSDLYTVAQSPAFIPVTSKLLLFRNNGNGTFAAPKAVISLDVHFAFSDAIQTATIADIDGDGIKDGMAVVSTIDANLKQIYSLQFARGLSDGSYVKTKVSSLASGAFDMVWGDFDKDARVDLAFLRRNGDHFNTTDVWLNAENPNLACAQPSALRTLTLCPFHSTAGDFLFIANPLDSHIINAMQIYVDGVLRFVTPDDRMAASLHLDGGTHRITAKAWDDLGTFSSTTNVTAFQSCSNTVNRTVKICSPLNGAVSPSTTSHFALEAAAATNLKFNVIQVYVDGQLTFQDVTKTVSRDLGLAQGTHRITVKGWDSSGAFSSSVSVSVQ